MSDGNETWYASSTQCVGEAYQVSFPCDTEHVRGFQNVNILVSKKLHFRRARAHVRCQMGMKLGMPLQHIMSKLPSFIPIQHRTCARARPKCNFLHIISIYVRSTKIHFGRARAHVRCWMGMKLGTSLQHIMSKRRTKFHFHTTSNMCAGASEMHFLHRISIYVRSKKLHFGRARTHVRCRMGMKLGTSLQHTKHVRGRVRNEIFY